MWGMPSNACQVHVWREEVYRHKPASPNLQRLVDVAGGQWLGILVPMSLVD